MGAMASQITSLTVVYSTVYSGADQRKHQSSASLILWGEFTGDRWSPRTKVQWRGKCFHLMTSSWCVKSVYPFTPQVITFLVMSILSALIAVPAFSMAAVSLGLIHHPVRKPLTHWGRDKMAAISQTTLSNAFSWMKMLKFRLNFHWNLLLRVQLTIFQHWFW